jgi:hypothetical protein
VLLVGSASAASGEKPPSITFAVLRQDGILIPFATIDGGWKNLWPMPVRSPVVPATLDAVPKAWWPGEGLQIEWTRWTSDGERAPLKVTAPAWFRAQCLANVGLRTDFTAPGPPVPPEATPYPKAGLATSTWRASEPVIEPVAILGDDSQDWSTLLTIVRGPFDRAETKAIKEASGWKHPYSNREREQWPILLESLYRIGDAKPGTFVYYFEAVRRYADRSPRRASDQACDLITFAKGWVRIDPRGQSSASVAASLTDCYRWNVGFTYPLGVARLSTGKPIWIVQASSWSAESYTVIDLLEPATPKVLISTTGGRCR